ncbi:MAG: gliding motility-associated C-terminal domain-containing protein [Brumimicrobium sp.]|nr:gliding motility-associated C-terminal domain-containing protein [Brumimicrobium sp.]
MSDKDYIKELFQKELGNYESKVNPNLWNNIQAGINSGSAGASSVGSAGSTLSVASKIVLITTALGLAVVGTYNVFFSGDNNPDNSSKENNTVAQLSEKKSEKKSIEKITVSEKIEEEENESKISENQSRPVSDSESVADSEETNNIIRPIETGKDFISCFDPKLDNETEQINNIEKNQVSSEKTEENKKDSPIKYDLEADVSILEQKNQYVKFGLSGENVESVEWNFGDQFSSREMNPEHFYNQSGTYEVIVRVQGKNQIKEYTLAVKVDVQGKIVTLPNVITPNNDGSNDELFIEHQGIVDFKVNIFNEKHELVFTSDDPDFRWGAIDLNGNEVEKGNYFYVIIAQDAAGNVINKYQRLEIR